MAFSIFVGWAAEQIVPVPPRPAPANYTKEETIRKFNEEEQIRVAAITDIPVFCELSEVVVVDLAGKVRLKADGPDAGVDFFDYIADAYPGAFDEFAGPQRTAVNKGRLSVIGFDTAIMLRMAAIKSLRESREVPAGFWIDPPAFNPYHACVPSDERSHIPILAFAHAIGVKVAKGSPSDPAKMLPESQAALARAIALAAKLVWAD